MKRSVYLLLLLLVVSVGCKRDDIAPIVPDDKPQPITEPYIEPVIAFGKNLDYIKANEVREFVGSQTFTYNNIPIDVALFKGENDSVTGVAYVFPKIVQSMMQASAVMIDGKKIPKIDVTNFIDSKYIKIEDLSFNGIYVKQWKSADGKFYVLCLDGSFGDDGSMQVDGVITVAYVNGLIYDMLLGAFGL